MERAHSEGTHSYASMEHSENYVFGAGLRQDAGR